MKTFKPTYLYIKQHSVTGMLYLGITTRNPETYKGSGIKWRSHIKKHGKQHVVNVWYCLYLSEADISEAALSLSSQYMVAESDDWANFIPENGINGGSINTGRVRSAEERLKQSHTSRGHKKCDTSRMKRPKSDIGKQNIVAGNRSRRKWWLCQNTTNGDTYTLQCMDFIRQFGGDFSSIHNAMKTGKQYKCWLFTQTEPPIK